MTATRLTIEKERALRAERWQALLAYWARFYATREKPSSVAKATAEAMRLGFDKREIHRAREKALEVALFGGELPGCGMGVSPTWFKGPKPKARIT